MQHEQLVASMTPELYHRLREAAETGRWPDGQQLTPQQRDDSMTLVMLYQARHLDQQEPFSIAKDGSFITKTKADFKRDQAREEIARFDLKSSTTEPNSR